MPLSRPPEKVRVPFNYLQKRFASPLIIPEEVADQIEREFIESALPYFEKYCEIQAALEVLARDDKEGRLHMPISGVRARAAVAMAWLLRDRDLFFELVERKGAYLAERSPLDLESFKRFVATLPQLE